MNAGEVASRCSTATKRDGDAVSAPAAAPPPPVSDAAGPATIPAPPAEVDDEKQQRRGERSRERGQVAPARQAARSSTTLPARAGGAGGPTSGSRISALGATVASFALMASHTAGRRLDIAGQRMQFAQPALPMLHQRGEGEIGRDARLGIVALIRIEGAEHVFGRHHVFGQGQRHVVRQRPGLVSGFVGGHDPRHSRISNRARRSHVLMVLTGLSNSAASCSRLQPL